MTTHHKMSIRKILLLTLIGFLNSFSKSYAQSSRLSQLNTPIQSLKTLCNALIKNDSILIMEIVTQHGYKDVKSQNLYQFAEKWLMLVKESKVTIFHESKNLKILKVGEENYLLSFAFDEKAKE